nr:hypothetical protein NG677_04065 [Methylobacterium sp. OTU13CASTA1]
MALRRAAVAAFCVFATGASAEKASDHLNMCTGEKYCDVQRKEFAKWFPLAQHGDYQGQRNVSFCLADGCDGAVKVNRALGCAWRLVIINSGNPKADTTDIGFFDAYCRSRLTSYETDMMYAQAREVFRSVYKRPPPSVMTGSTLERAR